jgi:hypothetical protein
MKNTNLQKKNSFAKIMGMKIADAQGKIITILISMFILAFILFPCFFKNISYWFTLINSLIVLVGVPLINLIISKINSLKGMQYIPLTENEVTAEHLDTIQEYVDFINELITYDNIIFCDYRSTVPKKIATQVCEFGNTYYSSLEPIRYDRYEKKHFFVAR